MLISVFDRFEIDTGLSSSHTISPMLAAARSLHEWQESELLQGELPECAWPHPNDVTLEALPIALHGLLVFADTDRSGRYNETGLGGLSVNVTAC